MTTPNNYDPVFAVGTGATVTVAVPWPFSNTLADLYVYQRNTETGDIVRERDGDFIAQVVISGESVGVLADNYWGEGTEVEVTVNRASAPVQSYNQPDGESADPYALEAALDLATRILQEQAGAEGEGAITSLDPYSVPDRATRANTFHAFDEDGEFLGVAFIPTEGVVWISNLEGTPVAGPMKLTGASPVAMSILDDSVEISNEGGPINVNVVGNLQENGIDVFTQLPAGTPNRLVTVDADGNLTVSELDYSEGTLQLFNRDYLTIKPGPGIDGMNLTLDGNTEAAELNLLGSGTTINLKASTSLAELIANTALKMDVSDLRLFQGLTGLSRILSIYGGATGADGQMDISVNSFFQNRAEFRGTVNEFNFIGTILQNGSPLIPERGGYQEFSFTDGNIVSDADGDYYLLAHNFDTDGAVFVSVFDNLNRQVQTVNVKAPGAEDNQIKVYLNGYTPLAGTFTAAAYTGGPIPDISGDLTQDEIDAIRNAPTPPDALNPFVTVSDVPGTELTQDESDAIKGANNPSASNVFLTEADQQLTSDELAGLRGNTPLSAANPVVTEADQQLTSDELLGIQSAATPVTGANPVVTEADQQLTADELAGIQNATTPVTGANPVVTVADIPEAVLTDDEVAAIKNANNPTAVNHFTTVDDIPSGLASRVVAATVTHPDIGGPYEGFLTVSEGFNVTSCTTTWSYYGVHNIRFNFTNPVPGYYIPIVELYSGDVFAFMSHLVATYDDTHIAINVREGFSGARPITIRIVLLQFT